MNKGKIYLIAGLVVFCLAIGGYAIVSHDAISAEDSSEMTESKPSMADQSVAGLDVAAAMAPRGYGDPNAPVVIEEYASLTCGHCAAFHNQVFPQLKEKYIDTGKVYFIFNDFPLNQPAMAGAAMARCLPETQYFKFIAYLFETQDKWAFDQNFEKYLTQNAKLLGLSGDAIETCLESEELRKALVTKIQDASRQYEINSTPSFVINGGKSFSGARPLAYFEKQIEPLLKE